MRHLISGYQRAGGHPWRVGHLPTQDDSVPEVGKRSKERAVTRRDLLDDNTAELIERCGRRSIGQIFSLSWRVREFEHVERN